MFNILQKVLDREEKEAKVIQIGKKSNYTYVQVAWVYIYLNLTSPSKTCWD
jgi:hypothetical protein